MRCFIYILLIPLRISSLFSGAFGAKKSGIVLSVLLGLFKNSTCHSAILLSFT